MLQRLRDAVMGKHSYRFDCDTLNPFAPNSHTRTPLAAPPATILSTPSLSNLYLDLPGPISRVMEMTPYAFNF
jgi:hypothetical protein